MAAHFSIIVSATNNDIIWTHSKAEGSYKIIMYLAYRVDFICQTFIQIKHLFERLLEYVDF